MMRPREMQFIRIIGPNSKLGNVTETLYDLKLLHMVDFKKSPEDFFDIGEPLTGAPTYSEELVKVRSMIAYFKITGQGELLEDFSSAEEEFAEIEEGFKPLADKLNELKSEENRLRELLKHPLVTLGLDPRSLSGLSSVKVFVGRSRKPIKDKLAGSVINYQLTEKEEGKREFSVALAVSNEEAEKAQEILSSAEFVEAPKLYDADFADLERKVGDLTRSIADLESALTSMKNEHAQFLLNYELTVAQLNEKAEVPLRFASSKNAFVASGWIPKETFQPLRSRLTDAVEGKVEVEALKSDSEPPIALRNPKPARPFEWLCNMFAIPRYSEIDPTLLVFLVFPLFFGFMLGDVGYGLVLLTASIILKKKAPSLRSLIPILNSSALAAIIFGIIYGEYFGLDLTRPLINRMVDVNLMIQISVAIGFIHVTLGLSLGFYNELKRHNWLKALFSKGGWLILEFSGLVLLYGYMNKISLLEYAGIPAIIFSLILIVKDEGIRGVIELPTIFVNILSYVRLFAAGLASAALALVFNTQAGNLFHVGGLWVLFAIFVLGMGHLLNIMVGLMDSFLQSLRLQYVEFFTKFFEGGGKQYRPFGSIR